MAVEPAKLMLVVAQEISRLLALPGLEVCLPDQEKVYLNQSSNVGCREEVLGVPPYFDFTAFCVCFTNECFTDLGKLNLLMVVQF